MGTNYRVDRVQGAVTPVGMNSLLWLGDSYRLARRAYDRARFGIDTWGRENSTYGVALSVWNPGAGRYVVKCIKGVA